MAGPEKQTFAGYEIIAKLGQGGMGAVYKARQPALDRLIALKVMASDLATDRDFVARFKREASIAASLSHPNVVQVYTAGESEGTHYIAMEFVDGQTLRDHIEQQGRLDPREAVAITVYVAEALQYAWNRAKLIHRDIKPDNIFLSKAGEVKVGDLGLAKTVGGQTTSLTQTGTAMGSPHYISPEQATGAKEMDFRTDIYSLGGTLYHMLTGQTPYSGDSSMVVMMKHVNEPPPAIFKVWPQCPMPLGLLVGKMLAKNRSSRPASYEELIEQLRALHDKLKPATVPAAATVKPSDPTQRLTPTPRPAPAPAQPTPKPVVTKTPTVTPKARESKPASRNSRLVIGAGALAAVALIAGAVWWFADNGGGPKVLDLGDGVKMELVAIPPGEFLLGSNPPRKAAIREQFWLGRTEVTVGQWKQFVAATGYQSSAEKGTAVFTFDRATKKWEHRKGVSWRDPDFGFALTDDYPVCCMTWDDAVAFCEWLTERERKAGRLPAGHVIRLPIEAEWEYACRGGREGTKYWWGDSDEDGEGRLNWSGTADGFEYVSPADHFGARGRNGFGLADMLGNVQEWCFDTFDSTGAHGQFYYDARNKLRVLRGGNPMLGGRDADQCHIRFGSPKLSAWGVYGFRVCLGPDVLGAATNPPDVTPEPKTAPAIASPKFGVLFDGTDTSAWQQRDGGDCQWEVRDGTLVAGKSDLDTREKFQDFKLHVEFAVPRDAKQGNSGIYLQGRYEVQILDSFGKPADDICCGSIFRLKAPTENASKPPDEWQTFDIGFRAARFDATGAKTANARVSVLHNGKLIHDYVEIPKSTGKGDAESAAPGPIRLQAYGSPVRFRNISIRPVDEAATAASSTDGAWVPLDISAVCNRSTILPEPGKPVHQPFGLTGNSWVTTGWLRARGSDKTSVPDDGRVAIPGADSTGFFQLRVGPGDDCILLCIQRHRDRGREIPATLTLNVPANQQRKFAKLAFLHASEPGDAEVSVSIHYDTGEDGKDILHPRAWARDRRKEPLTENETAVPASDASKHPVDMVAETLPVDPQRVLKSLTFTFASVSPKCKNPLAVEKCRAGIFAISALSADSALRAPQSAIVPNAGFVSLFNGKDLTGWEGRPEFWSVQDGAICGATTKETRAQRNTFLVCTVGEFGDFELRTQFKMAAGDDQGVVNSGVQYRSQIIDREYFQLSGYQADLGFMGKKNLSGGFWEEGGRRALSEPGQRLILREGASPKSPKKTIESLGSADDILASYKENDWNDLVIIASGNRLQHYLNGKLATEVIDETAAAAKTGTLALQIKAGPPMRVWFRNLFIKKLGSVAQAGEANLLDLGGGVKMELVSIPPGEFMMGSTKEEQAWARAETAKVREGDQPRRTRIKNGFWLGRTEVTVNQWKQFVAATGYKTDAEKRGYVDFVVPKGGSWGRGNGLSWRDPGHGEPPRDGHPVCAVSWNDAMAFCGWLTERERNAGRLPAGCVVRLPAEAEWEYACRAGTQTRFWWGDEASDGKDRLNGTGEGDGFYFVAPVDHYGERGRNAFGLADMLGNVLEWCLDDCDVRQANEDCYRGNPTTKTLRGGSFNRGYQEFRCAARFSNLPDHSSYSDGFRVCLGPDVLGSAPADSPIRNPQSAIAPDAAWQNAINLLPLIDLKMDAVHGPWKVEDGALISGSHSGTRLEVPYRPPEEYDFRIVFTRRSGTDDIQQMLCSRGRSFMWTMGMFNRSCGFRLFQPEPPYKTRSFENGRRYTSVVQVRKDGVSAYLDDECLMEWKTDYSNLQSMPWSPPRDPTLLGVGSARSEVAFHRIEVREVTGKGTFTRGAPASADAAWQNAINLLPLIDPQKDAVAGVWTLEKGELVGDKENPAVLEIPYQPPEEYDYRVEFTNRSGIGGGGSQHLVKGASDFVWRFFTNSEGSPNIFGFQLVNGKPIHDNPTKTELATVERSGRHVSLVEVRNDGVRGWLDGKQVVAWKTGYTDMSNDRKFKQRNASWLGVGCQNRMIFHRIEVREVTGKGTFTRGAPAIASAGDWTKLPNGWRIGKPVNLGPGVNSNKMDADPCVSADGLTLLFTSDRPGGQGGWDIWMCRRSSARDDWGPSVNLGPTVNSEQNDGDPCLSADGRTLLFFSDRTGGYGKSDLWMSTRSSADAPWSQAVNLGPTVNSPGSDGSPCLSADGLDLIFHSSRPGTMGGFDLWECKRRTTSEPWGAPVNLGVVVNNNRTTSGPCLSTDGLALFFGSDRAPETKRYDLWMSTRKSAAEPFGEPINLGEHVNRGTLQSGPSLSSDSRTLYYYSNYSGGQGGPDLWQVPILPPDAAGDVVNLLALASVPRDAVYGNWSVTADGLAVERREGATALEFPYDVPEEYDYEIEFTPQGNGMNVNQYLSAGGHAFAWKLNSHGVSPPVYGLDLLDGKYAKDHLPEAAVQKPMPIEAGKRYTSKFEVRRSSLRALVNGEEYMTWSGDFNRLSMEPHTKMKDERHLGIGSWRRGVVFHRAELRKVGSTSGAEIHTLGNHRYQFVAGRCSWDEAKSKAEAMGGHLAIVRSKELDDWVKKLLAPHLTRQYQCCWIGASRPRKELSWRWVTGEPVVFTAWGPGQPNYVGKGRLEEPYYLGYVFLNDSIDWNDVGITEASANQLAAGFLVEWDDANRSRTTPGTPALQSSASADAGWQNAINLLPLIDPQKDAVGGKWKLQDGQLVSDPTSLSVIQIPYQPADEYDYRIEFVCPEGGYPVSQVLSKAGHPFAWIMGASNGLVSGFETVAGKGIYDNQTKVVKPGLLKAGQKCVSVIEVRHSSLRAYINGQLVAEWKTNYSDMDIMAPWKLRDNTLLGLGCKNSTVFHRFEVREVTGRGTFTRGAPAAADAGWQNAINLLPLIDLQQDAMEGTWTIENSGLKVVSKSACARVQLPYQPPDEYDFRITFTRQNGADVIWQILSAAGHQFSWCVAANNGRWLGFELIGAKKLPDSPQKIPMNKNLENGRRYTSLVQVRKDGLKAFLDDRLIKEWKTDYQDMSLPSWVGLKDKRALGFGAFNSSTIFHSVEVREVTGKGTFTRTPPRP